MPNYGGSFTADGNGSQVSCLVLAGHLQMAHMLSERGSSSCAN
jgi:hypothetical protein